MSELCGQEYGWYLTKKLVTLFLKLGKPSKVHQKSWLNIWCIGLKMKVAW